MNKKAQSTLGLFLIPIVALIFILMTGSFLYLFNIMDSAITGENIIAGGQNISNDSLNTFGQINTGFTNSADLIVILFIFGYVIALILVAYLTRNKGFALFFFLDIIIVILAYIISVYISNSYETILNSLPYASTIITNMNVSSSMLLNLPTIVTITGAIVMIISYIGIPQTREEEVGGL